jgi:hypothetical protein
MTFTIYVVTTANIREFKYYQDQVIYPSEPLVLVTGTSYPRVGLQDVRDTSSCGTKTTWTLIGEMGKIEEVTGTLGKRLYDVTVTREITSSIRAFGRRL